MKNLKYINLKNSFVLGFFIAASVSCERNISDEATFATFPTNADVFIDSFTGGLDYLPFGGSKLNAFTVDTKEAYKGTSSMRFDVPNVGDSEGAYAGAIFKLASISALICLINGCALSIGTIRFTL